MQGRVERKRLVALVLGAALVVTFGIVLVSGAIGDPSIGSDDVALVEEAPDGAISQEEYDQALRQAAFNLQLQQLPPEDDPQFEQVQQAALSNVVQSRWVHGEAEERGIEVDDRDVDQSLDTIITEQLGGQKGYKRFLESSKVDGEPAFTADDVREVAELTAISDRLQQQALPDAAPAIPQDQIDLYYQANIEQFQVPETRDVRVLLNPDEAKAQQAFDLLSEDDSAKSWEQVAKKYSTDEATKTQGGLRRDVAEGQNEPALDEAMFSAATDELVGPIEGQSGFYVIQVDQVTPGETTPIADVSDQIKQTLQQGVQTQAVASFRDDFIQKWTSRTFCSEDVVVEICANADPAPEACAIDDSKEREQADPAALEAGCGAPVTPRNVVNPATGGVFPGEQTPALPQLPCGWIDPADTASPPCVPWPITKVPEAAALPPGVPLGPDGAPIAPGTTAPPQGAPPTGP